MSEFNNVTVVKKANIYFGGNVTSRTVKFSDGSTKTLGFILPGEYVFNVGVPEIMDIQSGELDVLLPKEDWKPIKGGESFSVPENSQFTIRVHQPTDYICSFV